MQKIIDIPEIGKVEITKKRNSKNLKIRVHQQKGVLVSIPLYTNFSEGEKFVLKNIEWVKSKLKNLEKRKVEIGIFEPNTEFRTRSLSLTMLEDDISDSLKARFDDPVILIRYKIGFKEFKNQGVQNFIKEFILKCLKYEAHKYLPQRIENLSMITGLKYKNLKINTASGRLGSCSSVNNINLSARLMLLPDHLIDYVILHELCHIPHKNHGDKFHELLNKLTNGNSKELNAQLKKYKILIEPGDYRFL